MPISVWLWIAGSLAIFAAPCNPHKHTLSEHWFMLATLSLTLGILCQMGAYEVKQQQQERPDAGEERDRG